MINDLFLIWYNLLVKNISQNTVVFVVISPRNDKKVSFVYKLPQTKKTNKKKDLKNDKKKILWNHIYFCRSENTDRLSDAVVGIE